MTWFVPKNALGADFKPGAYDSTLHWQVIWPRAIAKAWEDKAFHEELKADPRAAIAKHFDYVLMPDLDLVITDAPADATFDPSQADGGYGQAAADPWSKLPNLKLHITIPPAPPAELQGVAITTYQDTGRTYPFSCC
ncbi:MAG: BMA_0021/BMA_0022 family TOMM bacteriocin [Pseudomonadota bacterium]